MTLHRVFLSLYALIVLSILVVGWSVDRVWQAYSPEPEQGAFEQAFFTLVDQRLAGLDLPQAQADVVRWPVTATLQVQVMALDALAQSQLANRIRAGETVATFDAQGRQSSYRRVAQSELVVRASSRQAPVAPGTLYVVLLVAFYLLIGLVVYFWVWPLSRDLRQLALQARALGGQAQLAPVTVGPGSAVQGLASAFNAMAARINALIASHKEMTSAVSHELRTPLARMKFALALVEAEPDAQQRAKQLAEVIADVVEMEKLINDLLNFAGYEQSQPPLQQQPGDLAALAACLLRGLPDHIRGSLCDHLHGQPVFCEWRLMERALINLIQNAGKYAHSQMRVTLCHQEDQCSVRVADDGPGIAAADRHRVFEPFVRLRTGARDRSGFGLGLAIVRRIALWHGGEVQVTASDLGGAEFVLNWPQPHTRGKSDAR